MKERVKELWVAALRSGRFKQTKGRLKFNKEHCCLGVLCELAKEDGLGLEEQVLATSTIFGSGKDTEIGYLPKMVMDWAWMKTNDGSWLEDCRSLAELNDDGASFEKIAKVIEENWRDL